MRLDYVSSDTFQSTRITHAIDATWVADNTNISATSDPNPRYRWRLEYVFNSVTYVVGVFFDLVRYPGGHQVTGLDVESLFPGFMESLPTYERNDQGARLIDIAYTEVKHDLHMAGLADQAARNAEVVNELVRWKANHLARNAHLMDGGGNPDVVEVARMGYQARLDGMVRVTTKIPFSTGQGGGARVVRAVKITRR